MVVQYLDRLRDPRWQRRRLEILNLDGWQCTACLSVHRMLVVHHVRYERGRMPWDYPDAYLQTLCGVCHDKLKGWRHGSILLFEGGICSDGACPQCGSSELKDKGSNDKCLGCCLRFGTVTSFPDDEARWQPRRAPDRTESFVVAFRTAVSDWGHT